MNRDYENILHPLTLEQFYSQHWEQSPLHIERSNHEYFSELLSVADIEALLSAGNQFFPDVQLVNANADIAVADYTGDNQKIVTSGLWRHYQAGATLILSGAARRFPKISSLCRRISSELQMRSHANVYLSPGSQQGFNAHYDTHDVFVLQVSGRKTFHFYHSDIELPFVDAQFNPEHLAADNVQKTVQETVNLNPGDSLYIPRGVVHDAVAQGDEASLHITLGVYPVVARDILQEMIQVAAEGDVSLRRSVAVGETASSDRLDALQQMLATIVSPANYESARARLFDDLALDMVPSAEGLLSRGGTADTHGALSRFSQGSFKIDEKSILSAERQGEVLKLRVAGQILEFPEPFSSAVERLMDKRTVSADSLTDLDDDQRLALYEQLRSAGCIAANE